MTSFFESKKLFFLCGSQHLYGASALKQVENNTQEIVSSLNESVSYTHLTLPTKA